LAKRAAEHSSSSANYFDRQRLAPNNRDRAGPPKFMNITPPFQMLMSSVASQVPVMIVCMIACVVVVVKWRDGSRGSVWALLGFAIALVLCLTIPVTQYVQYSLIKSQGVSQSAPLVAALALVWSLLRALSYGLLLVAVFAGREADAAK
jgi:hypothetical protein